MQPALSNLGQAAESVDLLTAERDAGSEGLDNAVSVFLAPVLVDVGREREAVSLTLAALATYLPRHQCSLANDAKLIGDPPTA